MTDGRGQGDLLEITDLRTHFATADGAGWYAAHFTAPARGYVSLRVSGRDSAGNTITQDVVRAYGLRGR